ncbi:hypothetical protein P7C70_g8360, partial [Phenoliferia sp. Uapishka_3]
MDSNTAARQTSPAKVYPRIATGPADCPPSSPEVPPPPPPMHKGPWTEDEDEEYVDLWEEESEKTKNGTVSRDGWIRIAAALGRTLESVKQRKVKLIGKTPALIWSTRARVQPVDNPFTMSKERYEELLLQDYEERMAGRNDFESSDDERYPNIHKLSTTGEYFDPADYSSDEEPPPQKRKVLSDRSNVAGSSKREGKKVKV